MKAPKFLMLSILSLIALLACKPVVENPNCILKGTVSPHNSEVTLSNGVEIVKVVDVDANGEFSVEITKGSYIINSTCFGYTSFSSALDCSGDTQIISIEMNEEDPHLNKVNYVETDDIFLNPERGFYNHLQYTSTGKTVLTKETVISYRNQGQSLLLTIYYMPDFRDKAISDDFLLRIRNNMESLRAGGSKCVLRFAYTSSESDKPWDAPKEQVLEHIAQLKPIIREYADVIYVMEAGFVGVWGEWYYTSNFGMTLTTIKDYAPRRAVLDALLDALPKERMVCVRTPQFKLKCFDIAFGDTLTQETAYAQSDLSRIAAHNDCFLATSNDMGTFSNDMQRNFWASDTRYTVMGGETCCVSEFSTCDNALVQMARYHFSYLNINYHTGVLNSWKTEGCMDEVKRKLGYRLVLTQVGFGKTPRATEELEVKISLKNVGFAAPINPRDVELVFVSQIDANERFTYKIDVDPRYWFANGHYTFNANAVLDQAMSGKSYDVYLSLPDPMPILKGRPEYSIRMANVNVWNAELGFNKLGSISVN